MIKEDLKNILLSLTENDYKYNVDFHMHSNFSDGKMDPKQIVEESIKLGKKYIAITDHNTINAYLETNILAQDIIIPAVEFDCFIGLNLIHILGYGINIDDEDIKNLMAKSKYGSKSHIVRLLNLKNPKTVIEKIKKAGGIAVLAHPACYFTNNLDYLVSKLIDFGLEGIEVYYPYKGLRGILKFHSEEKIYKIAEKYNLIKTGGSDFHGSKLL